MVMNPIPAHCDELVPNKLQKAASDNNIGEGAYTVLLDNRIIKLGRTQAN